MRVCFALVFALIFGSTCVGAQTTEFNYQGSLVVSGTPANGNYDLEFALFDAASGGTQVGTTQTRNGVAVANGVLSAKIDFGNQFLGAARFLEIRVRPTGGGTFTPLTPRQQLTSTPYAIKSLSADVAGNASQLGGAPASSYLQSVTGSSLTGNGTNGSPLGVSVPLQLTGNLLNQGIISAINTNSAGAGVYGRSTLTNSGGDFSAGVYGENTGTGNGVYGRTISSSDSYAGVKGEAPNGDGVIGVGARNGVLGTSNSGNGVYGTSTAASFAGVAGYHDNTGAAVSGFSANGRGIWGNSTNGYAGYFEGKTYFSSNVGIGTLSPTLPLHVVGNGLFTGNLGLGGASTGDRLHVAGTSYFSDKVGIGSNAGSGLFSVFDTLGGRYAATIESTASAGLGFGLRVKAGSFGSETALSIRSKDDLSLFNVWGDGSVTIGGSSIGSLGGVTINSGESSSYRPFRVVGYQSGGTLMSIRGDGSVGIGTDSPIARFSVAGTGYFGGLVGVGIAPSNVARLQVDDGNTAIYGHSTSGYGVRARSENTHALFVEGSTHFTRWIELEELLVGGGNPICRSGVFVTNCNASSMRYKKNISAFGVGLQIVKRLRPIRFDWQNDSHHDFGLSAEEVEKVAPDLVFYEQGKLEGVRYEKLPLVLINAVKEQQAQIDAQAARLSKQQSEIDALRSLVCSQRKSSPLCRKSK